MYLKHNNIFNTLERSAILLRSCTVWGNFIGMRPARSISPRFLILILLVATPIAIFDVYHASEEKQRRITEATKDLTRSTDAVVGKVSDLIDASHELLTGLATVKEIISGDIAACTHLLHKVGGHYTKYTNFSMVNRTKDLVCSSGPLAKPIHLTRSPNINAAFATQKFAVSPFKFGVLTGEPILVFSKPIFDAEKAMMGTINNGLSLTWLSKYFASVAALKSERIIAFDGHGTVLASYPEDAYPVGSIITTANVARMAAEIGTGTGTFKTDDGEIMMAAFATIPRIPNGAHVVSFVPLSVLQMQIESDLYNRLWLLVFFVTGVLLLGWGGARVLLLNPIDRLVASSEALAKGNLKARSDVANDAGELGRLGVAFNHMAEALDARTETMSRAREEAENANKAKSEFLASMSHELRTPLNAVLGFAQMLQFDPKQPLTISQNEHVECIINGGNHLLILVNDILDLARVEADQISLSLEDVNINSVIADCVSFIMPLGEGRDIMVVDTFSDGSSVHLRTDAMRFKQVVLNLLSNAIKFNKNGGRVTVSGRETSNGFFRISVTDVGIGIADENRANIFKMFHRLEMDPMIAREGTGIGLTVTKLLLERMAGRIGFESTEGVGSTFWIELPLATNKQVLIWTDALRVGVDAIDKDHQVIIALLNRARHDDLLDQELHGIISDLVNYTHYHFRREETVMEVCGSSGLIQHRQVHLDLTAKMNDLAEAWHREHNPENIQHLMDFLRDWWIGHIADVDTKIAKDAEGKGQEIRLALDILK